VSIDNVAAGNFYKDDGDKIKQNWFLYEYSNILFSKIKEDAGLAAYRKRHGKDGMSKFCVYFSKRMRQSIFNAFTKQSAGIVIDARYIYEFYPGNARAQTQRLLEAASSAWGEHVQACSVCPSQCLGDGFCRTDMFDNLEKTGWPTLHPENI